LKPYNVPEEGQVGGGPAPERRKPSILEPPAGDQRGSPAREVAMVTERQVQETVARFVACMVFYVNSGRTRDVKGAMITEIQATARLVAEWGLSDAAHDSILGPVGAELVARYGLVEGRKLSKEFAGAIKVPPGSRPVSKISFVT
jgi:hypothetical protein